MSLRLVTRISTSRGALAAAFEIGCERFELAVAPGRQIVFIVVGLLLCRRDVGVRHFPFITVARFHKHALKKLLTATALVI